MSGFTPDERSKSAKFPSIQGEFPAILGVRLGFKKKGACVQKGSTPQPHFRVSLFPDPRANRRIVLIGESRPLS